jgi:ribosome-associated protein
LAEDENLLKIVEAIHARHGFTVRALDMTRFPLTVDLFLITSSDNKIQSRAIADHVEETAEKMGWDLHHREGYEEGSWILLDFVDFVVHVFLVDKREYYNLEMLWSDAPVRKFDDPEESDDPFADSQ